MLNFIPSLWISFVLVAIGCFGLFFSISLKRILYFASILLAGILFNFINAGVYFSDLTGKMLAFLILLTFGVEVFVETSLLQHKKSLSKLPPFFYAIPFAAFVLMAISLDLISFFVALELFQISFFMLAVFKDKGSTHEMLLFKEGLVSLASTAYGLSLLYLNFGTVILKNLQPMIARMEKTEPLVLLSVLLIGLGVLIKIKLFVKSVKKHG